VLHARNEDQKMSVDPEQDVLARALRDGMVEDLETEV
jgi:hypothetical protein